MKITFLLTAALALPWGGWFKAPANPAISSEVLDGLLKTGAKEVQEKGIKNAQIIITKTGEDAGKAIHGVRVQEAAGLGKSAFQKGHVQVIGLTEKNAHMLPLKRVAEEGAGINRLQRQFGLAPKKMTVGEATVIGVGATAVLGGTGFAIDSGIKHHKKKEFEEDQDFRRANGGTVENGSLTA